MADNRTTATAADVGRFLSAVEPEERRQDGMRLDTIFREVTGWEPRMWGPSIVGYGRYAYTYESGRQGEMCATGFSPRNAELSIYILPGYDEFGGILARLGKYRTGKSCLYAKRLAQLDETVLKELIRAGLDALGRRWTLFPD